VEELCLQHLAGIGRYMCVSQRTRSSSSIKVHGPPIGFEHVLLRYVRCVGCEQLPSDIGRISTQVGRRYTSSAIWKSVFGSDRRRMMSAGLLARSSVEWVTVDDIDEGSAVCATRTCHTPCGRPAVQLRQRGGNV